MPSEPLPTIKQGVITTDAAASGAAALGALALGAAAFGAVAIGAFAIGRLSVKRMRIGRWSSIGSRCATSAARGASDAAPRLLRPATPA